jgi:hypothetical protein
MVWFSFSFLLFLYASWWAHRYYATAHKQGLTFLRIRMLAAGKGGMVFSYWLLVIGCW